MSLTVSHKSKNGFLLQYIINTKTYSKYVFTRDQPWFISDNGIKELIQNITEKKYRAFELPDQTAYVYIKPLTNHEILHRSVNVDSMITELSELQEQVTDLRGQIHDIQLALSAKEIPTDPVFTFQCDRISVTDRGLYLPLVNKAIETEGKRLNTTIDGAEQLLIVPPDRRASLNTKRLFIRAIIIGLTSSHPDCLINVIARLYPDRFYINAYRSAFTTDKPRVSYTEFVDDKKQDSDFVLQLYSRH